MNKEKKSTLLEKAIANRHIDFIDGYVMLADSEQHDPDLMMCYADSLYELGKEAESIDAYLEFALRYPKKRGRDFALFGAAMAFKNIGLEVEALYLLRLIKPNHAKLNEEIFDSQQKIGVQSRALNSLTKLKQTS